MSHAIFFSHGGVRLGVGHPSCLYNQCNSDKRTAAKHQSLQSAHEADILFISSGQAIIQYKGGTAGH